MFTVALTSNSRSKTTNLKGAHHLILALELLDGPVLLPDSLVLLPNQLQVQKHPILQKPNLASGVLTAPRTDASCDLPVNAAFSLIAAPRTIEPDRAPLISAIFGHLRANLCFGHGTPHYPAS